MHEEHRKRMRARFLQEGLEHFAAHEVLEFLLFYAIPRSDTNNVAHRLLEHFGSLKAVLEAPVPELCQVKGIGENAAVFLHLTQQLTARYMQEVAREPESFDSAESLRQFVIAKFLGRSTEVVLLLCMDNVGRLLNCAEVATGSKHSVQLDNRQLLETAFRTNATRVVLAHNHPSGVATPSAADVQRTRALLAVFDAMEIRLLDHLIVAGNDCFSMAGHRNFAAMFVRRTTLGFGAAADSS